MITIKQAFNDWEENVKPLVIEHYNEADTVALSESWNDYTDSLCKDGELTSLQYNYCPSYDERMPKDDIDFILDCLGFDIESRFIPYTGDDKPSIVNLRINWECTIKYGSKSIVSPYFQGIGHLPAKYKPMKVRHSVDEYNAILSVLKTGKGLAKPDVKDVLWCLLMDSDAIDCESFEDWADNYGFDADSIKDKKTYDACLTSALKLRNMLGEKLMNELKELYQDY